MEDLSIFQKDIADRLAGRAASDDKDKRSGASPASISSALSPTGIGGLRVQHWTEVIEVFDHKIKKPDTLQHLINQGRLEAVRANLALIRGILPGSAAALPVPPRGPIPANASNFVSRLEIEGIAERLTTAGLRMASFFGPPCSGRSTALEVAAAAASDMGWVVRSADYAARNLSGELSDVELLRECITALGMPMKGTAGDDLAKRFSTSLVEFRKSLNNQHALLVLDNVDSLMSHAKTLDDWMRFTSVFVGRLRVPDYVKVCIGYLPTEHVIRQIGGANASSILTHANPQGTRPFTESQLMDVASRWLGSDRIAEMDPVERSSLRRYCEQYFGMNCSLCQAALAIAAYNETSDPTDAVERLYCLLRASVGLPDRGTNNLRIPPELLNYGQYWQESFQRGITRWTDVVRLAHPHPEASKMAQRLLRKAIIDRAYADVRTLEDVRPVEKDEDIGQDYIAWQTRASTWVSNTLVEYGGVLSQIATDVALHMLQPSG
jgi:hypothetical protein